MTEEIIDTYTCSECGVTVTAEEGRDHMVTEHGWDPEGRPPSEPVLIPVEPE